MKIIKISSVSLSVMAIACLTACGGGRYDDQKQSKNEIKTVISQAGFGQDTVKAFVELATLKKLTDENKNFTISKATTISYGLNGVYNNKLLQAGTYNCGNAIFGDPAVGITKACFEPIASTELKTLATEYNNFTISTATTISYGINGVYNNKLLQAGTYNCGNAIFGDPVPGLAKACYSAVVAATLNKITGEFSKFTLTSATTVTYGINGVYATKLLQAGTYECGNDIFGDPVPGIAKACYSSTATVPNPTNPNNPTTPNTGILAVENDVMVGGVFSAVQYQQTADMMGTDAGIAYRYGPSAAGYANNVSSGLPTYAKRPDQSYKAVSIQLPNGGDRGCGGSAEGWCGTWSIGGPLSMQSGDYSSSIANIGYVPDAVPDASFAKKKYLGVSSLQHISMAHNAFAAKPEPSWTTYDGSLYNNGDNDENMEAMMGTHNPASIGTFPPDQKPVAVARGYGRGGWVNNSLAVFANGWIASMGSNTSHNRMKVKLADGKIPTAITITNSGEFALVTVWDKAALKGQVAVIALGDGCQGCEEKPESQWYGNWGNSHRMYAGFPGLGNYLFAKVVGYVDLPDNMKAPTEISASTGNNDGRDTGYQVIMNLWDTSIEDAATRKRIFDGDLQSAVARTGMAVVISKSEQKAAFIDLRPLFKYYRDQYTGQSAANFNTMVANRGLNDNQWPYNFSVAPSQKPTVIKTIDLPNRPTAVKLSLHAPFRAYIATQEGKLRVYDLGTNYLNQTSYNSGTPSDIVERFSVDVGKNPTSIAYQKGHGWAETSKVFGKENEPFQYMIVTSRGDRKVQWVKFDKAISTGSIFKTLTDSRLEDPIAVEDADNHGTESYVLGIADYSAKKIRNYLYGPVVFWTHDSTSGCPKPTGCALLDNKEFEYGGDHLLPGKPFHISGGNIN